MSWHRYSSVVIWHFISYAGSPLSAPSSKPSSHICPGLGCHNVVAQNNYRHLPAIQEHLFVLGNLLRRLRLVHVREESLKRGLIVKRQFRKGVVLKVGLLSYEDCGWILDIVYHALGRRRGIALGSLDIMSCVRYRE